MWGELLGAAVGGLMGGGGGGASETASKEPWDAVQPWLRDILIPQGQNLSAFYTQNPFNAAQTQAYGNMANQGAYMRSLVPGLLGQMSNQPIAFDRANPEARPQAFNFNAMGGLLGGGASGGLGLLNGGGAINPVTTMPTDFTKFQPAPAPAAPAPAAQSIWNMTDAGWRMRDPGIVGSGFGMVRTDI